MSSLFPCFAPLRCCAGGARGVPLEAGTCQRGAQSANSSARARRERCNGCARHHRRDGAGKGRLAASTLRRHVVRWTCGGGGVFWHLVDIAAHIRLRVAGLCRAPWTAGTDNAPGLWTLAGDNSKRETGKQATAANIQAAKVRPPAPGCSPCSGCVCWWCLRGALVAHAPCHRQAVSDIIRTTLGPRSMLKMLLDPMGGIGASCLSALSIRMRAKVFAE